MGCDIHTVFQLPFHGSWIDFELDGWDESRNYKLFSWLANVRNSSIQYPEYIQPIAQPKGFPKDFQVNVDNEHITLSENFGEEYKWMGEHSHSWLTFTEIINSQTIPPQMSFNLGDFILALKKAEERYGPGCRMVFGFDS